MNEIISIQMNDENEQVVSARELHKQLEVKTRFSLWVTQNFNRFTEGNDFTSVVSTTLVGNGAKRQLEDYLLSLDMAKHISLMSGTTKGSEIRNYFITAEKKLREVATKTQPTALELTRKAVLEVDDKIVAVETRMDAFEANALLSNSDYGTIGKEVIHKVHAYRKAHNVDRSQVGKLFRDLNGQIKEITGAPSRGRIKQKDFEMVMDFIDMWEPKTSTKMAVKQTELGV